MEWSVAVTLADDESEVDDWLKDEEFDEPVTVLLELLERSHPTVSLGTNRYSVRLTVKAPAAESAVVAATRRVKEAVTTAGLPEWPIVMVETVEWGEFERQLEIPSFPDLAGISEVAKMLGVSRQRASELAQTDAFPVPVARLASGPVWIEPNVRGFIESWERKPGRPKKQESVDLMEALKESVAAAREKAAEAEQEDDSSQRSA